jgi:hypothetical protein
MTQADSVHSTPRTNTSARHSRRSILSGIAAGSIATLAPAVAAALPQGSAPAVSPSLRTAIDKLGKAYEILLGAQAANDAANELVDVWERENPMPASRRGRKRWWRKHGFHREAMVAQPWQALMKAELVFAQAQVAVALVPIAGVVDLHAMAACASIYDRIELARGTGG